VGSNPFSEASASLFETADREIDWLGCGIICWKAAARFSSFSDHSVQAFDRICGADDFPHRWWEG
jgi:hypothetical protein